MNAPAATRPQPGTPEHRRSYRRALTASSIGWGLDGFDHTMFPLALGAILATLGISTAAGGTITTVSLVASAIGGMAGGVLGDRFGRARTLIWVIIGFSVFTALTATAQNIEQLIVWRVLEGLFFGAEWPVGVALLSEYTAPERRGRVMAFMQSVYSIGWAASTISYFAIFSLLPQELAWRVLFLVGIVPALFVLWIRRNVSDAVHRERPGTANPFAGLGALFVPGLRRTTIVSTVFMVGGHGNYYAVVSFLPLYLSTERGLQVSGTTTYLLVQIVGGFIGYVSSGWFHDRFGRRPTQTTAYLFAVSSMVAFLLVPVPAPAVGYLLIFLVGMCVSACAGGLGAILSEQFPTHVRSSGLGFSYNVGRGFAALGPMVIGIMAASWGLGMSVLLVGSSLAVLATVMLWLMPETLGKEIV